MSSPDKQLCQSLLVETPSGDDVRKLIAAGASANAVDAGMSALHWAARRGLVDAARALVAHGAELDARSANGASNDTPMHSALWVGAEDESATAVVGVLVAAGASAGALNAQGEAPIHLAAQHGLVGVIDVLAPVSSLAQRTHDDQTALERALVQQKVAAVVRLLVHGAPIDDACVKRASQLGPRVQELVERTRRDGTPTLSSYAAFACVLAEHVGDGPALDAELTETDVVELLQQLATELGNGVGAGLAQNDDVDHFQEEYGDGWLGELVDSYWMDAHEATVRAAWAALPTATQQALPPLESVLDDARERFQTAVESHA